MYYDTGLSLQSTFFWLIYLTGQVKLWVLMTLLRIILVRSSMLLVFFFFFLLLVTNVKNLIFQPNDND